MKIPSPPHRAVRFRSSLSEGPFRCRPVRSVCSAAAGLIALGGAACGSDSSTSNAAAGNSGLPGAGGMLDPDEMSNAAGVSGGGAATSGEGSVGGAGTDEGGQQVSGGVGGNTASENDTAGDVDAGTVGAGTLDSTDQVAIPDERPFFSFFTTSQAGLFGLTAGEIAPAPDPANGYGGNFGGLAGADEICTRLAGLSSETDSKVWRAFLSTAGLNGGEAVDAIDRIGEGPWFDFNGRLMANDLAGLVPQGNDGRPQGADPQLAEMFTDENGDDIQPNAQVDNHDMLTGSNADGRLFGQGDASRIATCEDWTSNTLRGAEGDLFGNGGQVPVGHAWPRNNNNGRHWMSEHTVNGCEAGFDIDGGAGAPAGDFRVGAGGGYGGFYCFALDAVPPQD